MSTAIFPTLPGQGWSITRTAMWQTRKQVSISGKETVLADWSAPKYQWELVHNLLRQGPFQGNTWTEMQALLGFYNARSGGLDSFLYQDQDDNSVTGQLIGYGDGSTQAFPLVRSFGVGPNVGTEPILAPNSITGVYLNGVRVNGPSQSLPNYTWVYWGQTVVGGAATALAPGTLFFSSAPAAGAIITADFQYYWPCRFVEDQCIFEKFMAGCYAVKKLTFLTVK